MNVIMVLAIFFVFLFSIGSAVVLYARLPIVLCFSESEI